MSNSQAQKRRYFEEKLAGKGDKVAPTSVEPPPPRSSIVKSAARA